MWRCCVCSFSNLWEIAVCKTPVHIYHSSSYKCIFYTFPPSFDALSGSLRLAWICPWAISSLWRSYLPLFLSLWLHVLLSLSLSLSFPAAILPLTAETVKAICFGDTFTGCPGWTMTQDPSLPKAVTWFIASNKLAANYLSNTCWWRCWELFSYQKNSWQKGWEGAFPFDQKSLLNDPLPLCVTKRICQDHHISSLLGCDANYKCHVSCHRRCSLWDK